MKKMVSVRFALPALTLGLILAACGGEVSDGTTHVTALTDSGAGSLRQAIADAKAGDTLKMTAAGTVTLASPITTDKNLTIMADGVTFDAAGKGRVLEIPAGVTVTVKGGTLTGGVGKGEELAAASLGTQAVSKATYGGNLINRGTLTLDGTTVSNGQAHNGGGLFNERGATLTLKNVTMTGNKATMPTPDLEGESTGSGGAIANHGTLTIESGNFTGNTAIFIGGVIRHVAGTLTIAGGTFEGNTCTNAACGGGVLIAGGTSVTTISGGTFRNNTTTAEGGGGALLIGAANSEVTVSGGTFTGNSSTYGGAVNVSRGKLKITGGTFEGNTASKYGGAFQVSQRATAFEMTGGTIKGNKAGLGGGGINSDMTMTLTGGSIEGNTADESGGGINIYAQTGLQNTVILGGTLTIKGNTAKKYGGGVNAGAADQGGTTINIQGATIDGNTASDSGGGMNIGNHPVVNFSSGSISNNTAVIRGGGLVVGGQAIMTGGSISGNQVTGTAEGEGGGGGVQMYAGSKMTASGGSISNNKARWGAGVMVAGPWQTDPVAEFTLSGASVNGNQITDSSNVGGGFFNEGKLTITAGSVTGNKATQNGGGVFNRKTAVYSAVPGSVTGNTPNDVFTEQ